MKQARAKEIIFGPKDAQEMRAELDASPLIEGERKAVTALFADIKGSKTVMASVARVLFEVVSSFAVVLVAAGLVGGISDSAFRIAGAASVVGLIHALRSERASRNEIPVDVSNGVRGVEGFLEDTAKQMKAAGAEAAMIEITNLTENAPLVLGVVERFAEHHLLYCCALPRGLKDGELWLTRNESLKEAVYSEYRNSNLYEGLNDPKLRSLSTEPTRESLLRGLIVRRRLALRPRV
ncbi:MAG: hypothetical protein Q7S58_20605 [Candidatus Binatus sp.]|uniref:hypothetical protein n=1 Tax=Candidatus Binatus sp. TaxID=2811406 RepID=UPI002717BB41|nr:hypothetical protein [Candidatus Binatus sp.]MDO8434806.1 hypothetical protein [Candidatus Binatus sp.]